MVKRVKEWREKEGARWDELVQPSALFEAGLGTQPSGRDLDRTELEARRKTQEAEDQTILAKTQKFKESQADRPPKPVVRERIRPRLKPLGKKELSEFVPRPPPTDPLKERALKEMEVGGVMKKKRRVRRSEEEPTLKRMREVRAEETSVAKEAEREGVEETLGRVVVPELVDIASEGMEVVPAVVGIATEAGAAKLKADEAKAQLARLKKESVNWESAHAELRAVKLEPENERRQVVSLEFHQAGKQRKLEEAQKACAVALEQHEEAMTSNEELVKQKDEADVKIDGLQRELEGEHTKAMEERDGLQKELEKERAKASAERANVLRELAEKRAKAASEMATLQK
ncbi:uncharacterized protein LOC114283869 [Camellia sinensis]|uniref:uncharacterized protein LOC114283869 n=1 Tax=Camellia sinensis TaxID=4442 RepID=UPI001035A18F|nr:uncharacterized protein LOC114283869 [Camellia sinensis]